MAIYLNNLRHKIYFNRGDETSWSDTTFDITTDIQTIKNYLSLDSTLQKTVFESYSDVTAMELVFDDSWFLKDQTFFEVLDIFQSDGTNRYDQSVVMFTRDEIIYDHTLLMKEIDLHFVLRVVRQPELSEGNMFSFPLFVKPTIPWLANDLVIQYDVHFIEMDMFNDYALMTGLKDYIYNNYVVKLNNKLKLNYLSWNEIELIDYKEIVRNHFIENIKRTVGDSWDIVHAEEKKQYFHTPSEVYELKTGADTDVLFNLFWSEAQDFYLNRVHWDVDFTGALNTPSDLYEVVSSVQRMENGHLDILNVNFIRFLLIRNNRYQWEFNLYQDGTLWWNTYIWFQVKNIIPDWDVDFTFVETEDSMALFVDSTTDIPIKIDVLEYSNNLLWSSKVPYSQFVNKIYLDTFNLRFDVNKNLLSYGENGIRLFMSDTFSEANKDYSKRFVYAPFDIIKDYIAKINFTPEYTAVKNGWNPDLLVPWSDDFTSYDDFSAYLSPDATDRWMVLSIPVKYELIYLQNVPIVVELDATGPIFEYLEWDTTSYSLSLEPTLQLNETGNLNKWFTLYYRYRFKQGMNYTDDIIQSLNGIIHLSITTEGIDTTDVNYFQEQMEVPFITTRYKLRKKSHEPVVQQLYKKVEEIKQDVTFASDETYIYTLTDRNLFRTGIDIKELTYNKTTTIRGVPVQFKVPMSIGMDLVEYFVYYSNQDGDDIIIHKFMSPNIGHTKDVVNLTKSTVLDTIINGMKNFFIDFQNDYQSHIGNEIEVSLEPTLKSNAMILGKNRFQNLLLTDDSWDDTATLDYMIHYFSLDHNDPENVKTKLENDAIGKTPYGFVIGKISRSGNHTGWVKFNSSNIFNGSSIQPIAMESFLAKYYKDKLPSSWKYRNYVDGLSQRKKYITTKKKESFDTTFFDWMEENGFLGGSISSIVNWFMDNVKVDVMIDQTAMSLTTNEIIDTLIYSAENNKSVKENLKSFLSNIIIAPFSFDTFTVSRVYSTDLTCEASEVTEDVFTILIEPTQNSRLYSKFRITEVDYVYNDTLVELTPLYDIKALQSTEMYVHEVYGTGVKLLHKYLVYSTEPQTIIVNIKYVDEDGVQKTTSSMVTVSSRLQLSDPSVLSSVISTGVNIFKALWFLAVFDQNNQHVQTMQKSMNAVLGNTTDSAYDDGKAFQGAFFELRKKFRAVFERFLPSSVLELFYSTYIVPITLSLPVYTQDVKSNLIFLPENVQLSKNEFSDKNLANRVKDILESNNVYVNQSQAETALGEIKLNYNILVDDYMKKYVETGDAFYHLVMVPDTTYNIRFRSYLTFAWTLRAGDKAVPWADALIDGLSDPYSMPVTLKEFVGLMEIYPELRSTIQGIVRDWWARWNLPTTGRSPSAQNPVHVVSYTDKIWQMESSSLFQSASVYVYRKSNSIEVGWSFAVPYEDIVVSVDTTSTGTFYVNLLPLNNLWRCGNLLTMELCGSNIGVQNVMDKLSIRVHIPSVIPEKYLDVIVKRLF